MEGLSKQEELLKMLKTVDRDTLGIVAVSARGHGKSYLAAERIKSEEMMVSKLFRVFLKKAKSIMEEYDMFEHDKKRSILELKNGIVKSSTP